MLRLLQQERKKLTNGEDYGDNDNCAVAGGIKNAPCPGSAEAVAVYMRQDTESLRRTKM